MNASMFEKKIGNMQAEFNVDRIHRLIDKKMSKEEAMIKFEGVDTRVTRIEKVVKLSDIKVSQLEVRRGRVNERCVVFEREFEPCS